MSVVTYQQLHTEGLLTVNFTSITENFKTIDAFIKNFGQFQRKLNDLEKMQKATSQDLTNFKISTQNTFSTLNDQVQTRSNTTRGSSLADSEEIKQIKKSFKEIKTFITQNTREQHQGQQTRDKEAEEVKNQLQYQITKLKQQIDANNHKIVQLQDKTDVIKSKYATKTQSAALDKKILEATTDLHFVSQQFDAVKQMLESLNVKGFKDTIDQFKQQMTSDFNQIRRKFKLKADYSDVLKLQEMMINIINFAYQNSFKKFADKTQTKKALVFLEKRINKLMVNLYGEEEGDRQGLITTRGIKCISCTKDLGEMEGKLDKYKAWSIFPSKDPQIKDRYSGFGAGFQTIVETSVSKKGGEITYDEKGRMTAPFNLTRQNQGTLLKPSQSQSKITKESTGAKFQNSPSRGSQSPTKMPQMETNFMTTFGRSSQPDFDLKDEYIQKERGLMAYIKLIIDSRQEPKEQ